VITPFGADESNARLKANEKKLGHKNSKLLKLCVGNLKVNNKNIKFMNSDLNFLKLKLHN
jgi:hypothetical protein